VPTVLTIGGARVAIYTSDHRPAHVHVWDAGKVAVFNLNCPKGPVELRENYGFSWREVNRLAKAIQAHVEVMCATWRAIHGSD
jgi:hypothetical protein